MSFATICDREAIAEFSSCRMQAALQQENRSVFNVASRRNRCNQRIADKFLRSVTQESHQRLVMLPCSSSRYTNYFRVFSILAAFASAGNHPFGIREIYWMSKASHEAALLDFHRSYIRNSLQPNPSQTLASRGHWQLYLRIHMSILIRNNLYQNGYC